jgi:hypothetical protein
MGLLGKVCAISGEAKANNRLDKRANRGLVMRVIGTPVRLCRFQKEITPDTCTKTGMHCNLGDKTQQALPQTGLFSGHPALTLSTHGFAAGGACKIRHEFNFAYLGE